MRTDYFYFYELRDKISSHSTSDLSLRSAKRIIYLSISQYWFLFTIQESECLTHSTRRSKLLDYERESSQQGAEFDYN